MIEFFVAGHPRTKGSSKNFYNPKTKKTVYIPDNEHLKAWQSMVSFTARQCGCKPVRCPVELVITYILPRPKGHFTKYGALSISAPPFPAARPDVDKMERAILDSLTGVVYLDDGQVVKVTHGKIYTESLNEQPGARIVISFPAAVPEIHREVQQARLVMPGMDSVDDFDLHIPAKRPD